MKTKHFLYIAFTFNLLFLVSAIVVHLFNVRLSFVQYPLSWYVKAQAGWLLATGLCSIGFSELMLAIAMLKAKRRLGQSGICLLLAATGVLLVAVFPIDHNINSFSMGEQVHFIGAFAQFLFFPLSGFFYAKNKSLPNSRFSLLMSFVSIFLTACMAFFMHSPALLTYYGLVQKINILVIAAWIGTVSLSLSA